MSQPKQPQPVVEIVAVAKVVTALRIWAAKQISECEGMVHHWNDPVTGQPIRFEWSGGAAARVIEAACGPLVLWALENGWWLVELDRLCDDKGVVHTRIYVRLDMIESAVLADMEIKKRPTGLILAK